MTAKENNEKQKKYANLCLVVLGGYCCECNCGVRAIRQLRLKI